MGTRTVGLLYVLEPHSIKQSCSLLSMQCRHDRKGLATKQTCMCVTRMRFHSAFNLHSRYDDAGALYQMRQTTPKHAVALGGKAGGSKMG